MIAKTTVSLAAAFGLAAIAMDAALADPPTVTPGPAHPVQVTNTAANPVPITAPQPLPISGSVTVSGTSNVNVTNASIPVTGSVNASQSGTWNVGITGTPTVKVSNDPSLQTPYSNRANGSTCGIQANPCTVPAGSRLVIEYISGIFEASVNPSNNADLIVNDSTAGLTGSQPVHTFLGYPITGSVAGLFAFSTPFKMILNAGAQYYLFGAGAEDLTVTGYLIPQP
jgi:hypothetical protein